MQNALSYELMNLHVCTKVETTTQYDRTKGCTGDLQLSRVLSKFVVDKWKSLHQNLYI
jgi:hypothetical protein